MDLAQAFSLLRIPTENRGGEHGDAVLVSLALMTGQLPPIWIDVLDANLHQFLDTETAAILQLGDGAILVGQGGQDGLRLFPGEHCRNACPGLLELHIELHLLDFEGDLYGEDVRVDFVSRIRDVRPFDSVSALVAQMREDVEEARGTLDVRRQMLREV